MAEKCEQPKFSGYKKDLLLMLSAPLLMAWYYYGERALMLAISSVLLSLTVSFFCDLLLKKKPVFFSPSAAVTGLLIALMLPASASFSLLTAAVVFAFIVCSLPFGNGEKTPFVPAAGAIAFVSVCRAASVFTYPSLAYPVTAMTDPSFVEGASLASSLALGNSIYPGITSVIGTLIGEHSGPMGCTCALVLLAISVYMLIRYKDRFLIFLGYLISAGIYAALFPRILTGRFYSVIMELCSGMLLFGGIFLLPEPYCSPRKKLTGFVFGAVSGIMVMLFRGFGIFEDSTCFAILIMNALSPLFEKAFDAIYAHKASAGKRHKVKEGEI